MLSRSAGCGVAAAPRWAGAPALHRARQLCRPSRTGVNAAPLQQVPKHPPQRGTYSSTRVSPWAPRFPAAAAAPPAAAGAAGAHWPHALYDNGITTCKKNIITKNGNSYYSISDIKDLGDLQEVVEMKAATWATEQDMDDILSAFSAVAETFWDAEGIRRAQYSHDPALLAKARAVMHTLPPPSCPCSANSQTSTSPGR